MDATTRSRNDRRRRQRPALACVSCRKSKIRCDRQHPCSACIRSRHKTCVFEATRGPASRISGIASAEADRTRPAERSDHDLAPVTPVSNTTTAHGHDHDHDHDHGHNWVHGSAYVPPPQGPGPSAPASSIPDANELLKRLFQLERRLDESTTPQAAPETHDRQSFRPERGQVIESYLAADIHATSRNVVSKTRYFGQSHWMNGIIHFKSMLELFECQSKDAKSEAMAVLNRCKALGRSIKAQRNPGIISKFGTNIPPRDVADKLVDGYLRTLETVFRVLHIPSFRRDYERYWAAPDTVGLAFVIQLQLVMAIGSTIFDDNFSMRKLAVQWVMEAEYWLLAPPAKGKLTIAGIQIMILLALARETASVGGDLVWVHVGSLLRSAFYMGLHRDPSRLPKMSRLEAEIRRRLWNTILELELKSSIDSGGFPSISPDASDTRPPADVDDASLIEDDEAEYTGPIGKFTDMSIALALRDSFRERLAIYQMLNATPYTGTYDDSIRLHGRFMKAFKALTDKLKSYTSLERQPTSFQYRFVEIIARRCLMNLHLPYLGPGLKDPAYSFSRKQVTDTAVKIYYLLFSASSINSTRSLIPSGDDLEVMSTEGDDLSRFAVCGAGFWRLLGSQSCMIITLDLQTMLREDESLGPPIPRPDLMNILKHSLTYYLTRIKAGETNVKGYLFTSALAAHVHGLVEGLTEPKTIEPILSAAIRTEKICFDILKQQAGMAEDAEAGASDEQFNWDSLTSANEEWADHAAVGSFFDVSSVECFLGTNGFFDFMSPLAPF